MTRGIHERGYTCTGQEGCGTGEILGRRDRKGGMQDRRDAEQERCCTGGIGKVGCRTGGMKDWTDA